MDVTLLGTGCPQCDPQRMGPANLVRHGGRAFLVDCGSGVTQRLVEAGTPGKAIDALLLTHLHSDHLVDFYQLVVSSWHQGRDRPQRVIGPAGTRRFVDQTMALWKPELELRIAHEKRPSTRALEIEVSEIEAGADPVEIWRDDAVRIEAFAVEHQPVRSAFGYRFSGGGRRAVFSGDTRACEAVTRAAAGCDVLVHECFIHREMPITPGVRNPETLAAVASYHTLSGEVGKLAAAAKVGCLALNHFVPTRFDRAKLAAEVRADYAGALVIGEDLTVIDLDVRLVRWREFTMAY